MNFFILLIKCILQKCSNLIELNSIENLNNINLSNNAIYIYIANDELAYVIIILLLILLMHACNSYIPVYGLDS